MDTKSFNKLLLAVIGSMLVNVGAALSPHYIHGRTEPFRSVKDDGSPDVYVSDRKWLLDRLEKLDRGLSLVVDRLELIEKKQTQPGRK